MTIMEDVEIMAHINHILYARKTKHQLNKLEISRRIKKEIEKAKFKDRFMLIK